MGDVDVPVADLLPKPAPSLPKTMAVDAVERVPLRTACPPPQGYLSFRENLGRFLAEHGALVALPPAMGLRCWFLPLTDDTFLHVYEEPMRADNAICDQCRIIGARSLAMAPHQF